MEYIKINNEIDCKEADKLMNELIKYESSFDNIINGNVNMDGFHEKVFAKPNVFAYYAKDNDKAVGYIFAYLKNNSNNVIKKAIITVESLFVKEEFRKQGIGSELIKRLEDWARETYGNYVVEIVCLSNNIEAIKFYNKMGYNSVKTILRGE